MSREIDAIIAAIKATGSRWDRNFFTGEFTHTGIPVLIQVSGAFEDCPPGHLVNSQVVPGLSRIRIEPYIVGKVRCLAERNEIKDWWHLALLADCDPRYESLIFRTVAQWDDPALLVGRAKLLDPTDVRQLGGAARDCDLIDAFRLRVLSCFTPVAIDAPVP
ncbi:MAG: hypothetical protein KatS3mg082_1396 [Nitrospiraceae bacterium]|nr:MAG: hypothetical protein KatS3mg082_1396 [Nitrospiraceae bacterium]